MDKFICIKNMFCYPTKNLIIFKINEIYDGEADKNEKGFLIYPKIKVKLTPYYFGFGEGDWYFPDYFIPLAEWRNKQIEEIIS